MIITFTLLRHHVSKQQVMVPTNRVRDICRAHVWVRDVPSMDYQRVNDM